MTFRADLNSQSAKLIGITTARTYPCLSHLLRTNSESPIFNMSMSTVTRIDDGLLVELNADSKSVRYYSSGIGLSQKVDPEQLNYPFGEHPHVEGQNIDQWAEFSEWSDMAIESASEDEWEVEESGKMTFLKKLKIWSILYKMQKQSEREQSWYLQTKFFRLKAENDVSRIIHHSA